MILCNIEELCVCHHLSDILLILLLKQPNTATYLMPLMINFSLTKDPQVILKLLLAS